MRNFDLRKVNVGQWEPTLLKQDGWSDTKSLKIGDTGWEVRWSGWHELYDRRMLVAYWAADFSHLNVGRSIISPCFMEPFEYKDYEVIGYGEGLSQFLSDERLVEVAFLEKSRMLARLIKYMQDTFGINITAGFTIETTNHVDRYLKCWACGSTYAINPNTPDYIKRDFR